MPTTEDSSGQPHPPTDPRLAALLVRCRALRVELDRTDDALALLDRAERVEFTRTTTRIRAELDQLEADLERQAAR